MILNKACRGDQMVAHKDSFFSGVFKAHSVRPDSIHPDYQGFETLWAVRSFGHIESWNNGSIEPWSALRAQSNTSVVPGVEKRVAYAPRGEEEQ